MAICDPMQKATFFTESKWSMAADQSAVIRRRGRTG